MSYEYDQLNQLVHEINGYTGEEVSYTYDKRGNILSKSITKNGNTNVIEYENWKDLLTSYNGQEITYDAIGNPDIIDGWDFTWRKGRQLKDMRKGSDFVEFKYDSNGIRNRKTVNGVITEFLVDGSKVIAQKTGDNIIWFYYDGNGQLTAMQNGNSGEYYYYVHNLQGDIVGLLDKDMNFVANYTYDSWGKVVSVTGSNLAIANLNPFRYRGYYYDSETGLYYLNSRYYNPEIGRFINSDGAMGISDDVYTYNLFVYCGNNPVLRTDFTGQWWHIAAGVAIGAGFGFFSSVITDAITPQGFDFSKVNLDKAIASGIAGGISGGAAASGIPLGYMVGLDAGLGAIESFYGDWSDNQKLLNEEEKIGTGEMISNALISGGISALFTYLGGPSEGKQFNSQYKSYKAAKRAVKNPSLANGAKKKANSAIKTYTRSFNKFWKGEIKDNLFSTSFSTFLTEYTTKFVSSFVGLF